MNLYEVRKREPNSPWQRVSREEAKEVLAQGYFDPEIPLGHVEHGGTVLTSKYEVRLLPGALIMDRHTPDADEDGNIVWA